MQTISAIYEYILNRNYVFVNKEINKKISINQHRKKSKLKYNKYMQNITYKLNYTVALNWRVQLHRVIRDTRWHEYNYYYIDIRNVISIDFPKEVINMKSDELTLISHHITRIPQEIFHMTQLTRLAIICRLTKLPKKIGRLTNLQTLQLNENNIKKIPKEIGNLTKLRNLWIEDNPLKKLPKEIINLTNLMCFGLRASQIKLLSNEIRQQFKHSREGANLVDTDYIEYRFKQ